MDTIVLDNIESLRQGITLLERITPSLYAQSNNHCFNSGIGSHIRHNLDHYFSFLKSYRQGRVDYEDRERDVRIESDPAHAILCIKKVIERLKHISLVDLDAPVEVKADSASPDKEFPIWSDSTVRRELQFILHHAVHHYALISIICKLAGFQPDTEFGIAPSTLRYQKVQLSTFKK